MSLSTLTFAMASTSGNMPRGHVFRPHQGLPRFPRQSLSSSSTSSSPASTFGPPDAISGGAATPARSCSPIYSAPTTTVSCSSIEEQQADDEDADQQDPPYDQVWDRVGGSRDHIYESLYDKVVSLDNSPQALKPKAPYDGRPPVPAKASSTRQSSAAPLPVGRRLPLGERSNWTLTPGCGQGGLFGKANDKAAKKIGAKRSPDGFFDPGRSSSILVRLRLKGSNGSNGSDPKRHSVIGGTTTITEAVKTAAFSENDTGVKVKKEAKFCNTFWRSSPTTSGSSSSSATRKASSTSAFQGKPLAEALENQTSGLHPVHAPEADAAMQHSWRRQAYQRSRTSMSLMNYHSNNNNNNLSSNNNNNNNKAFNSNHINGLSRSDFCPSCQEPFDCGKKRRLIDSCGHERCYSCMFTKELCTTCVEQGLQGGSRRGPGQGSPGSVADFNSPFRRAYTPMGGQGVAGSPISRSFQLESSGSPSPFRNLRGSCPQSPFIGPGHQHLVNGVDGDRAFATPPAPRRRYAPSPKPSRPSWLQRHMQRRPQTVNVDDATLSALFESSEMQGLPRHMQETFRSMWGIDDTSSGRTSVTLGNQHQAILQQQQQQQALLHANQHLQQPGLAARLQNRFVRSSSLGGYQQQQRSRTQAPPPPPATNCFMASGKLGHRAPFASGLHLPDSSSSGFQSSSNSLASAGLGDLNQHLYLLAKPQAHHLLQDPPQQRSSLREGPVARCVATKSKTLANGEDAMAQVLKFDVGGSVVSLAASRASSGGTRGPAVGLDAAKRLSLKAAGANSLQQHDRQHPLYCNQLEATGCPATAARPPEPFEDPAQQSGQGLWRLKPLFFEVPQRDPKPAFVGRQWLFGEILEHLASELPTNRGVLISGGPGSGKTSLILRLVQSSCFGRNEVDDVPHPLNGSQQQQQQQPLNPTCPPTGSPVRHHGPPAAASEQLAAKVVAYHFCQADNLPTCLVPEFVHSLAAQLSQAPSLRPYHQLLQSDPELQARLSFEQCATDPDESFRVGVLEPLKSLQLHHHPHPQLDYFDRSPSSRSALGPDATTAGWAGKPAMVILVDGLCNSDLRRQDHGDTIGSFVSKHLDAFPDWLKVVATVRSSATTWSTFASPSVASAAARGLPFHHISLDKVSVDERLRKDLMDYVGSRMGQEPSILANITPTPTNSGKGWPRKLAAAAAESPPEPQQQQEHSSPQGPPPAGTSGTTSPAAAPQNQSAKFAQYLTETSQGCWLYVQLVLDQVARGNLVVKGSGFKVIPISLAQVFQLECNLRFSSIRSFEKVSDILSICAAARAPLTSTEIFRTVNALRAAELDWPEFADRFNGLSGLLARRGDDSVMICHPAFRDWLVARKRGEPSKFLCDLRLGHMAVALRLGRQEHGPEDALTPDRTLEMAHSVMQAGIFRDEDGHGPPEPDYPEDDIPARDLESIWTSLSPAELTAALTSFRNVHSPSYRVSKLLLASGANPRHPLDTAVNISRRNSGPGHRGAPKPGGPPEEVPVVITSLLGAYAYRGFEDMVGLLVGFRADVNEEADPDSGLTPLMCAAMGGHTEVARLLVEDGGALPSKTDRSDMSALVYAAELGYLDTVEFLATAAISGGGNQGSSHQGEDELGIAVPPHHLDAAVGPAEAAQQAAVAAASKGQVEVLEFLLDMPQLVRIDSSDTLTGNSPLCAAASSGQKSACDALLRRGADPAAKNLRGVCPIHLATRNGHWSVACSLLKASGSAHRAADPAGRTPLMMAALEGHLGLVELLLSCGADPEAQDKDGLTPLGWACLRGQLDTAAYLLKQGSSDVMRADNQGRTPLDLAAYKGNPDMVTLLLDNGAAMEHVDNNGMRPLDRAIGCRNTAAVHCFLKKGAKLGPATWAMANGKPDIMLLLLNKLLEDGNTLFRKDRLAEAAHRYQYALRRMPSLTNLTRKNRSTFETLSVHLLLNLSRCKRKKGDLTEAVDLANRVLHIHPNSFEAHYAKAKAHKEAGRLHEAVNDLTEALRVAPQNREIHRAILRIREEIAATEEKTSSSSSSSAQSSAPSSPAASTPATPDSNQMSCSGSRVDGRAFLAKVESEPGELIKGHAKGDPDSTTSGVDSSTGSSSCYRQDMTSCDDPSTSLII